MKAEREAEKGAHVCNDTQRRMETVSRAKENITESPAVPFIKRRGKVRSDSEKREGRGTRGGGAAEGDSEGGERARQRNESGWEEEMRAFLAQSVAHRLEGVNKAVIAVMQRV